MTFISDLLPLSEIYVHSLRSTSTDWVLDEQLLLYSRSRRFLFTCTIKWGNIESTNQRSETVCTVESSFQLSSSVYLRRCRTALVGNMLDQSNFLMCVT